MGLSGVDTKMDMSRQFLVKGECREFAGKLVEVAGVRKGWVR